MLTDGGTSCKVKKVAYRIFISHSSGPDDMEVVSQMTSMLESVGIQPYIAELHRQLGKYISRKIKNAIDTSDTVLGMLTKGGSKSEWVN